MIIVHFNFDIVYDYNYPDAVSTLENLSIYPQRFDSHSSTLAIISGLTRPVDCHTETLDSRQRRSTAH